MAAEKKKPVMVVESYAKVRTLSRFLRGRYRVVASGGHVRDLPEKWLGVSIKEGFKPRYEVPGDKKKVVASLGKATAGAPEVLLACDPDREGEAIAWHLEEVLGLKNARRVEFNEITRSAVERALQHPREIDMQRVDAQQARRVLDRIVGYYLSPVLWAKIRGGLSAGRVQSVALRLLCEREAEIEAFVPQEYWTIVGTFTPGGPGEAFEATLESYQGEKLELKNEGEAQAALKALAGAEYRVSSIERREERRRPRPPLITSSLQQEASRRLGFSARRTMSVAQQLYEGLELGDEGSTALVTYIRTDSVRVAMEAVGGGRDFIRDQFGDQYLPEKPRFYPVKASAQDAHEAIRPTDVRRTPDRVRPYLKPEQLALYTLIWQRFVASQMADAVVEVTAGEVAARDYGFGFAASKTLFAGHWSVHPPAQKAEGKPLPALSQGQAVRCLGLKPEQHFTQPPPRYNEASLIRTLEENGIGRPSTYAPIIQTLLQRRYVERRQRALQPTALGRRTNDLLVRFFPQIIDVQFTAGMEEELDKVERGKEDWVGVLQRFYGTFEPLVRQAKEQARSEKPPAVPTGEKCAKCEEGELVIREGPTGKFMGCSRFPRCRYTAPMPGEETEQRPCPQCGKPLVRRRSKYGLFWGCSGYPECKYIAGEDEAEVRCPQPGCEGRLVRRTAKRRVFYRCSKHPECDFATSLRPVGKDCPECGAPLGRRGRTGDAVKCLNPECDFEGDLSAVEARQGESA